MVRVHEVSIIWMVDLYKCIDCTHTSYYLSRFEDKIWANMELSISIVVKLSYKLNYNKLIVYLLFC